MLDQVRNHHRARVVEVAATVQFGRGHWVLTPAAGTPEPSFPEAADAKFPVLRGTAALGAGADSCYGQMAMAVLLAVLERGADSFRDRELLGAGAPLIIRVVACRRLLVKLRGEVSELGLGEEVFVGEVPVSSRGRLEPALAAEVSSAAGVVDVATDALKGRGPPGLIRGELVRLRSLLSEASAELHWIKGHAGDPLTELADRLAVLRGPPRGARPALARGGFGRRPEGCPAVQGRSGRCCRGAGAHPLALPSGGLNRGRRPRGAAPA
jgi:hypothetical protein